jgi:hypothetical protein
MRAEQIFLLPMMFQRLTHVVYVFRNYYNKLQTCINLDVLLHQWCMVYGVSVRCLMYQLVYNVWHWCTEML